MYKKTITLDHEELPAKVNVLTGEVKVVESRPNNIPEGKEIFEQSGIFKKDYTNSWRFLQNNLSTLEYKVAHTLAMMARANTNSLEPLNDSSTLSELTSILNVSINKVRPILKKLFELGVYGKFEVAIPEKGYTKYWIFNPYLSFSGKIIDSSVAKLFQGTHCEKAFRDQDYSLCKIKSR